MVLETVVDEYLDGEVVAVLLPLPHGLVAVHFELETQFAQLAAWGRAYFL